MRTTDRREFIASLSAAFAGLTVASAQSQDPATGAAVLGQGKHQWKVVPNWGVLDAETPVKDCHAMVQVKDGRIFLLTNHTKNNVIIYDKAGKLLGKWGTEYPGAHGLTLAVENGEEVFYMTDHSRHQVYKLALDGKVLRTWDYPEASGKYTKPEEYKPTHVALAPDGGFFVVDGYGKSWVHHYDKMGEYLASFGGNEPDGRSLACAHGAWVDTRDSKNLLWVTSRTEGKLKRFTMEGALVDIIDLPGTKPNSLSRSVSLPLSPTSTATRATKRRSRAASSASSHRISRWCRTSARPPRNMRMGNCSRWAATPSSSPIHTASSSMTRRASTSRSGTPGTPIRSSWRR